MVIKASSHSLLRILLIGALALAGSAAHADTARERLNHFFTEVTSLDAEFTQSVRGEGGELIQASEGTVQLKRPGRFRWHYTSPDERLILADGENLWIYDPELEQATVKPVEQTLGEAPIVLLTEARPVEEEFVIHDRPPREGLQWIELEPKVQDTEFTRIGIGLDETSVQRMVLHDQFGQTTDIRLSDLRTNVELEPSVFDFEPPAGVDVIGQES